MSNPFAVAQKYLDAPRPEAPTPEALAVSVLAEIEPDEVGEILRVWRETFGMDLDRDRVAKGLRDLREWQSRWRGSSTPGRAAKVSQTAALVKMAAALNLSPEEVNACAEQHLAAHGVDIRKPPPQHLGIHPRDHLYLRTLKRILELYKKSRGGRQ